MPLYISSSDENDLNDVCQEIVSIKYNYYQLGVALGLPAGELDSIRPISFYNVDQAFSAVLLVWLRQRFDVDRHGHPTWRRLVEAVDSPNGGNNPPLAIAIASRHTMPGRLGLASSPGCFSMLHAEKREGLVCEIMCVTRSQHNAASPKGRL